MKVRNETRYDTQDLRRLIAAVAERELEPEQRKRLVVKVKAGRARCGIRGLASIGWPSFALWINQRRPPDSQSLAWLIAHEMGHCRGLRHSQMRGTRLSQKGWGLFAWAKDLPVRFKPEPVPKPRPGAAEKLEHAAGMVRRWEAKIRRGETFLKRWKRKARYYDGQIQKAAMAAGGKHEPR